MRLPSLEVVGRAAGRSASRFPFVLLAGVASAACGIVIIGKPSLEQEEWVRAILTAALGIPLMFGVTMLAESRNRGEADKIVLFAVALAILGGFWWAWPSWTEEVQVSRYIQLSAAFHFFVAFAPYPTPRAGNGFWQYNRILFLRFVTAGVFSGVLYVGLSVALLALHKLFNVPVEGEAYGRLWMAIAFVFNTWFFVGGVPQDLGALDTLDDYPTPLRILTQFILVPIVAIYLLILTAYLAKVVVTRQWPNGWIGWLVSSVAMAGMFSWLLVHPLEERKEYAWVKPFTRGFYILLLPAIVMLWLAIWKRVDQYGITERRYFLIVLSVWLAGVALFYAVSRSRSIRLIPVTLCALAFLTFGGPFGAYSVSFRSQRERLETFLTRNGLLAGGHLVVSQRPVSDSDLKEISGLFRYLLGVHAKGSLKPWLDEGPLATAIPDTGKHNRWNGEQQARAVMDKIGLRYIASYEAPSASQSFSFYADQRQHGVEIAGYTHAIHLSGFSTVDSIKVAEGVYICPVKDSLALHVDRNGKRVLTIPFAPMIDSARAWQRAHSNMPPPREVLSVEVEEGAYKALTRFSSVMGAHNNGAGRITMLEGELFLRIP